eukprot:9950055-Lingulodinium_polyedra.AAC.1
MCKSDDGQPRNATTAGTWSCHRRSKIPTLQACGQGGASNGSRFITMDIRAGAFNRACAETSLPWNCLVTTQNTFCDAQATNTLRSTVSTNP